MNLRIAAESKFEGIELDELKVYCSVLGIEVKEGHNAGHLRQKLLKTLGEYNELNISDPEDEAASAKALDDMALSDLNLSSTGRWQGKRRIVTLHRAAAYDSSFPLFLAWENLHVYLPYGMTASLPWPIWKILYETSNAQKLVRKRHIDPEGRISFREEWVADQPYMYTDEGTDPETANLPGTLIEAVRMMYHASEGLKGYNRRQLVEVCRRLRVKVDRKWTDDEVIERIQTVLSIPLSLGDAAGGGTTAREAATA